MEHFWKNGDKPRFSPPAIAGMVLGGLVLAAALAFLFGWIVMLLWNWLMPEIFKLPRIGYWQAWGLVLLSHILIKPVFGGHGGSGHGQGRGECKDGGGKGREKDAFVKSADLSDGAGSRNGDTGAKA